MSAEPLGWVALVAASVAAAGALVATGRVRALAMLAALVLAPVVVGGDNWHTERFVELRDSTGQVAALGVVAVGGIVVIAWALRRWPVALPLLAFAALPFRVPVDLGGEDANLLLPLYLVIGGGVVSAAIGAWRGPPDGSERGGDLAAPGWRSLATRYLPWLLGGFLVLYAVQSAYSADFSKAVENVGFFFVPFAVLLALLRDVRWTRQVLAGIAAVVVAESLLFALVAFGEFAVRDVFWNPEVIAANEVHTYFRVNSLFWDPNVLGRYLVLAIMLLAAYMVWTREARRAVAAAATSAVLLGALVLTFSQSSLVALLAGLVALAALRWGVRWGVAALVAAALAGIGLVGLSGADVGSEQSLNIRSSGRAGLVRGGLDLATNRPLGGYGSGSFQVEFSKRFPDEAVGTGAVSHTEPVTVAAEQGLLGLLPYAALLLGAFAALLAVPLGLRVARSALVACFVAMVVHSLAYAGLLIDPATWALLGVGLALARRPDLASAPADERDVTAARPLPAPAI